MIKKSGADIIMYMNMDDIHKKYDGQWVYMINCEKGVYGIIAGGEVVLFGKKRDSVINDMKKYDYEKSLTLFRYIGEMPEIGSYLL